MFDISVVTNNWQYFAHGIWVTVRVTTSAAILGFCIAFVIALMRTSALLPLRIAAGREAIWVTSEPDGTLTRLDPESGEKVGKPVSLGMCQFPPRGGQPVIPAPRLAAFRR